MQGSPAGSCASREGFTGTTGAGTTGTAGTAGTTGASTLGPDNCRESHLSPS
jgi:hypothetical protein